MWNNFLAEIVKYLPLVDVKWNKSPHGDPQSSQTRFGEPLSRAAAHFTREAYFTHEVHFTNPARDLFRWKKTNSQVNWSFFLAGVQGFEPRKWRSQSPLPYRLATPQCVGFVLTTCILYQKKFGLSIGFWKKVWLFLKKVEIFWWGTV